MITEFKNYKDLPFSKEIQDELFKRHTHADLVNDEDVVYSEKDVLVLLQMVQKEKTSIISIKKYLESRNEELEERKSTPITEGRISENLTTMIHLSNILINKKDDDLS